MTKKWLNQHTLVALVSCVCFMVAMLAGGVCEAQSSASVLSPDEKIEIKIQASDSGQLSWSVLREGEILLGASPLGLTVDGQDLGQVVAFEVTRTQTINETYPIWGNHSTAVNHCNEAVLLVEREGGMNYELDVRAFDDGAAVRTRITLDDSAHTIAGESTSWALPADAQAWWARYDNSYEQPCQTSTFARLPENRPLAPPITFKLDGDVYVSLTEANNDCFPDMGLMRTGEYIKAVFPPSQNGWTHQGSIVTPWRVATIADDLTGLVNSDILTNLCPPPSEELANADWIKPGRSLWQWWAIGAPRMEDQKDWVDAAKRLGFEYYLIDDGWRNWRSPGKDQWQCLKEVIDYSKSQGVGALVWVNSSEMRTAPERRAYLEKVTALGAVGIKIDFIPACTAEITEWYEGALKDTAELKLLCNFHGAVKPTGRRRTWPHELTREGVRGHEYHMTRYRRVQRPEHDETVLFTRFLAGPADYTPTAFDPREMVGFTWPHLLSQAVTMTSPLLHFAGKYQDFIDNPAEDLIRHLPATWDETIVLPGSEIGKTVVMARRQGDTWFIGALNGADAADFEVDLSFLGEGSWQAEVYGDDPSNAASFKRESKQVSASDSINLAMVAKGGAVVWITAKNTSVAVNQPAAMFPLENIRLLDSYFTDAVEANKVYLLELDPDRLVAPYYRQAGLELKVRPYGNWESSGLEGHSGGHYLSAMAYMMATGNDEDGEFERRLDYMLDELEVCQNAREDGYLGGVPRSTELWNEIASGNAGAIWDRWAPWYNVHKTFAGLRDAYTLAGKEKARDMLVRLGDWCVDLIANLNDSQMQQMLANEYGGMNEVMADIYAITGEKKYLDCAERFYHKSVFDPLVRHEDRLTGLHANTQIPKVAGLERIAALTENESEHSGAEFFWETVIKNRSVAFGGNSVSEHFNEVDDFSKLITDREGPESCNTYNMLRLTEQLFLAEPKAKYVDYYERALYNHILSTINIEHPGYVYFTPLRPDHYRVYSQPETSFWCCVGTGMENPGKFGEFIYAQAEDSIYVNLFIPSELKTESGVTIRQETQFPYEASTKLTLKLDEPKTFTLYLRHPGWATEGFGIKVNGAAIEVDTESSLFEGIHMKWKDGDTVEMVFPMNLQFERLPDGSDWLALLYGPIVLAKPDGTENMDGLFADSGRMAHVAHGPMVPLDQVPTLLTEEDELLSHIVPDTEAGPLHFRIKDIVEPAVEGGVPLEPFFSLHEKRYQMYWELTTAAKVAEKKEALAAAERERAEREAATIDSISVGEQQSEVEHDFQGDGTATGINEGRRWRHGNTIQYTLATDGEKAIDLEVTYWGSDRGRSFDIFADDVRIASQALNGEKPGEFFAVRYSIPEEVIAAADGGRITIKFVATRQLAGGLFDVRFMRPESE